MLDREFGHFVVTNIAYFLFTYIPQHSYLVKTWLKLTISFNIGSFQILYLLFFYYNLALANPSFSHIKSYQVILQRVTSWSYSLFLKEFVVLLPLFSDFPGNNARLLLIYCYYRSSKELLRDSTVGFPRTKVRVKGKIVWCRFCSMVISIYDYYCIEGTWLQSGTVVSRALHPHV